MKQDTKRDPKKTARNKADKLFQEVGRKMYSRCAGAIYNPTTKQVENCTNQMSCLHHHYRVSTATNLRYEIKNGIPLCKGCHFREHTVQDPDLRTAQVLFMKERWGEDWEDELRRQRMVTKDIKSDLAWYKVQIDILQELLNNSEANAYLPPQDLWRT